METKILILLFYYNRPKMVLNALQSINELNYNNFEVIFIDDSGDDSFKNEFYRYIRSELIFNVDYRAVMQTDEYKRQNGGSTFGKFANDAIKQSDAEIAIMLCDDDALFPNYLKDLNYYYRINPQINYAYSYVKYYDPSTQHFKEASEIPVYFHSGSTYTLNLHNTPIEPICKIDASQVSWKTRCNKEGNIWFPYPHTRGLDAALFTQMYKKYGPCYPLGEFGQYKGAFPDQLGNRGDNFTITLK